MKESNRSAECGNNGSTFFPSGKQNRCNDQVIHCGQIKPYAPEGMAALEHTWVYLGSLSDHALTLPPKRGSEWRQNPSCVGREDP
ncbi:hypothetical protein AVEN_63390-1 [Araneus ventricosus]|uniref:Uncharacterized protein n=1 Tax=Araneus ventricosus TaxID=182803 RepID=A0A4Y2WHP1_ARAVE|nr:hypothetical protein AVEN_63390-1 [Araneus ventricosus]